MKKAAIYCRVSTDKQRDNYSVPSQIQACLDYADSHDYKVVGDWFVNPETGQDSEEGVLAYVDDISSSEVSRPALEAAYRYAVTHGFGVLIVHALDRMARSAGTLQILESQFREEGVTFEFVLGGYEPTAEGNLFKEVVAVMANYENIKRTERSDRGKRQKAKSGLVVGRVCYGYIKSEDGIGGVVEVPSQAEIVKRIFNDYVGGSTISELANSLNRDGVPSPSGGKWGRPTVHIILRNEDYTGKRYYNKRQRVGKKIVNRPRDEWIEISIPAIIDDMTFRKAAERLDYNRDAFRSRPSTFFLLAGVIFCSECGKPYGTGLSKAKRNGKEYKYKIYRHRGKQWDCKTSQVVAHKLDDAVLEIFTEFAGHPAMIWNAFADYKEDLAAQSENKDEQLESLDKEIGRMENKRNKYIEIWSDGIIPKSELESKLETVDDKLKHLKEQRAAIDVTYVPSDDNLRSEFENFVKVFSKDSEKMSLEEIRQAMIDLNARVLVTPKSEISKFEILSSRGSLSTPGACVTGFKTHYFTPRPLSKSYR